MLQKADFHIDFILIYLATIFWTNCGIHKQTTALYEHHVLFS